MMSMSGRHIFILVLMVYVCVLNILLVNSLFKNYLDADTPKIESVPKQVPWRAKPGKLWVDQQKAPPPFQAFDTTQPLQLDNLNINSDCLQSAQKQNVVHLALVPSATSIATHNDLEAQPSMRLLSEVRHALRHGPPIAAHVTLLPTVHTFLSSHRKWCETLHAQTLGRAECDLALLRNEATDNAVFEYVLQAQPCMQHLVLLHDAARVTVNFFAHLRRARDDEVFCLAQRLPGARRCPLHAFRLPRVFLLAYATQFANTSIEDAAAVMRMDGGDAPAVRLA